MHDTEACGVLERKHEYITELYNDWGNLGDIDVSTYSESFQAWLQRKRSLFFVDEEVRSVHDISSYVPQGSRILLDVPILSSKKKTMERIAAHINLVHALRMRFDGPKYKLHGDFNKATQGTIEKAIYVAMHQGFKNGDKPLSQSETVIAILQDPENPFGDRWRMTPSEQVAYAKGTLKKTVVYAAKMKQIKFYRDEFDALVKNTIHGRFPDFS